MANNNQDILVELGKRELQQMLGVLKQHLPQQIRVHNYILNYLMHFDSINACRCSKDFSPRWNLRFYGHRRGTLANCTLVTLSDTKDYCITVFTLEESADELAECLQYTNRIQWNVKPLAFGVDVANFNVVNDIVCGKRNDWQYDPIEYIMYIPREKVLKLENPCVPKEFCIRPLDTSHAELINEHWAHKYECSYELIKQSIEMNGGVAMLRKDTLQPVAWVATNDFFTPGFLHTVPVERRKGYGTMVFTQELKRLVKKHSADLFTFVVCNNRASVELHRRLGFTAVNSVRWIISN